MDTPSPLVEALDARWLKYSNNLEACRQEFSEEAVHDVRVSTRRLLALVELLRALSPHPHLEELRRAFKDQLDSYDDLRDTQVMLLRISATLAGLPELAPYEEFLKKREEKLLRRAAQQVNAFGVTDKAPYIESTRQSLLALTDGDELRQSLLPCVDEAYAVVLHRYNKVDSSRPSSIHRLRVAFKKLRYMLEIVQPLLPEIPARNFKDMHAYQTAMGDIQDLEVLLAALADFAKRRASYDPGPARRYFQRSHALALYTYLDGMQQVHTFWRPAPEAPFPWAASPRKKRKPARQEASQQSAAPVPGETDQEKGETS
ncbi:MAG: CHAD domain-containing protein [Chloroflexota bacterium]